MALQSIANINIDFYDNKYILINAKQLDKKTRFLSVTCYNHGELFPFDYREHSAYIRYKKADNHGVFNFCEITKDGKILIELTEQMLASSGICTADIVIVNRGQAEVDTETGEIVNIDRASVLSTMTFYIDVSETAVENSEIESSYEYSAFNQSLETYWADFEEVMQTSKSYAVGNAGGIRENENFDNAKYYYELALTNANTSSDSADAAARSEANAKASEAAASNSEANAKVYKENANTYMNNAENYMEAAKASETAASNSEVNAATSESNAESYMNSALEYKNSAYDYSVISQRYAVGGTNTVSGEDEDNSKYYYELSLESADNAKTSETNALNSANIAIDSENNALISATNASDSAASAYNSETAAREYAETTQSNMESAIDSASEASTSASSASTSAESAYNYYLQAEAVVNGLNGAFLPKGTITFTELATLVEEGTIAAGYLYNISDNFTTDDTFRMGAGVEYEAGTNVYYTVDGYWDCLAGTTVTGVKGSNEITYRKGNVNLTAENVGAISTTDIATIDEVKTYLGII